MQVNDQPQVNKNKQGFAIASLVLGIFSILLSWIVFIGPILAILAIVFGILAIKSPGRGMAIGGIITAVVGLIFSALIFSAILKIMPEAQRQFGDKVRREDTNTLVANINEYRQQNNGEIPGHVEVPMKDVVLLSVASGGDPTEGTAVYQRNVNCEGVEAENNFAITVLLEDGQKYCQGS